MHQLKSLIYRSFIPNVSISYETVSTSYDTICNYSKNGYRYGFNGKEKVNEIAGEGNDYGFGARFYDGRLGRWFSVYPLMKHYAAYSCFNFAGNSPIVVIDKQGKKLWDPILNKEIFVTYVGGNPVFKTIDGQEPSEKFKKDTIPYLTSLSKSEAGRILIVLYQSISKLVVFDNDDQENLRTEDAQSAWRPIQKNNVPLKKGDGFYYMVIITPFNDKIAKSALNNRIEYDEKLIQVLTVEYGHFSTQTQIKIYDNQKERLKIYSDTINYARVYNKLINDAIRSTINYRIEKGLKLTLSAFLPFSNFKQTEIGSELKLDDDLKETYDFLLQIIDDPNDTKRQNKLDNDAENETVTV